MQLVFIHGPAACGKLTVANELVAMSGMRLFHNHLTVDLVRALFDFGSEPFVRLRESIWLEAFREAAELGQSLVFTFHPEASVRSGFLERVISTVSSHCGEVVFIELTCPESEIERRISSESRANYGKLRSLSEYVTLRDSGAFSYPALPAPALRLDTSTPCSAASRGSVDIVNDDGNSAADMAYGPSRFFIPKPETADLLVKLGSPFQDNCRSDQCVDGKFLSGPVAK